MSELQQNNVNAPEKIISIRGLEKSFGELKVLRGIDLDIKRGEQITIIGPSGCGKSTLLSVLAGVRRPAGGTVSYKGAPLFSLGVPVTFLGDHMQLPPVCEMDVSEQSDECTCLWAQSAIHLDTLFSEPLQKIHHDYLQAESPQWTHFTKSDLTETHCFSHALSSILAGYVYSPEFHSVATVCTELIVLDTPRRKESISRTSTAEIEAIAEYLRKENIENYAILSPYRKQVAQLAKRFPSEHKDERILTVHASQGREWDTVFFSVVDTSDMFFCNTRKTFTKGKQVVSTAVSRAKRRLVIVCDYDYWAAQSNQLITDLILSAEKYPSVPMS